MAGCVTDNLNNNNKCIAVFLDLAKAFDTVPHKKLLDVLVKHGVRGTVLDVFKSYLSERHQVVKIRNNLSDQEIIKIGVPQGTVLGPVLFITYINSLTNIDIPGSVISYADDTVLLFKSKTWKQTKNLVIEGVGKVKNWLDTYKLSLNIKKTNYIAFSLTSINRPDFNTIKINNLKDDIKETSHTKYLGIIVDQHLKWDRHVLKITTSIRKLIHKFYLLREFLRNSLLITIYKVLVESLIRYGIIAWGGLYDNALKQLNVVQNFILKIIYKKNKLYSTNMLYSENVLNVRSLYILTTCSYVHKSSQLQQYVAHQYQTRTKINKHLKIPVSYKNINLRFVNYLAPKFYNLLPPYIKQIKNIKIFNKTCKTFIFENYNVFVTVL